MTTLLTLEDGRILGCRNGVFDRILELVADELGPGEFATWLLDNRCAVLGPGIGYLDLRELSEESQTQFQTAARSVAATLASDPQAQPKAIVSAFAELEEMWVSIGKDRPPEARTSAHWKLHPPIFARRGPGWPAGMAASDMISSEEAYAIAVEYVRAIELKSVELTVYWNSTQEDTFGWVFFWGPADPTTMVAGNAPFIVQRTDGKVISTGTARPIEHYLRRYLEFGDPHAEGGSEVVITARRDRGSEIDAIKAVRRYSALGMKEAKEAIAQLWGLSKPTVRANDPEDARRLVEALDHLGFSAKQLPEGLR
ncbi:MAG: hypothetical protein AAF517_11850 [Planctomycetota bacterium]